ncbi:murein hydrolase activator EnvC family protein [Niallia sp. Sow4_A1]|uniref:murein hydrolase activator EnvC family protein n=1 Tax=unclassified Niallia TaxID=2837522 RepID=UPI003F8A6BA3
MKKTLVAFSLITSLGLGTVLGEVSPVKAAEYTSSDVESVNNKIQELQKKLETASLELGKLNSSIKETQTEINNKNQQITETKRNIEGLQAEIDEIWKRIEARNVVLKDRARSLQESGGTISYLEVLLGAQSFGDFINRTEAVLTIVEADQDILKEHQNDKERVEKAQAELESELLSIESMRSELKNKEADLITSQQEQETKEKAIQDEVKVLEKERNEMMNQIKIANANKTKKESTQNIQKQSTSSSNDIKVEAPQGNGDFIWPTIGGVITSYQGPRWGSYHKGIDIAAPSDYSIIASKGGTVYYTGWYYSAGLTVKIKHDNGYTTEYSHLDSIGVEVGQIVAQGQKVGIMGNTGESTGTHLDFKVYQNGNLLNPIDVLPKR